MKQYLMVALGLAALTGCSENAAAGNGKGGRPDALVRVAKVTSGPLPVTWTYMGEVRSMARAQLSVSEAGVVVDVRVREGDRVTRGDLLLRVDPNLARAQLVTAEAARRQTETEREQAERDAKRFDAAGRLAVPAAEIERARAEVASLEAQGKALEAQALEARVTMERHRITAPFAGLIARRFVDPGDWITAGARALELVADDSMEI
ncbi:MAG: efflux RND transporter periplasmic adaptor subunit, partial [Myxococcales bacterium]|nr:efflux RND transporter periplasmic adaptor subunit [Myxococcales bacterium]